MALNKTELQKTKNYTVHILCLNFSGKNILFPSFTFAPEILQEQFWYRLFWYSLEKF